MNLQVPTIPGGALVRCSQVLGSVFGRVLAFMVVAFAPWAAAEPGLSGFGWSNESLLFNSKPAQISREDVSRPRAAVLRRPWNVLILFGFGQTNAIPPQPTEPPRILTQPDSRTVVANQPVTFNVTDLAATSYQWFHNNKPIQFAVGGLYHINSATRQHDGIYYVVLSNAKGTTISRSVRLRVIDRPIVTLAGGTGTSSSSARLTATVDPNGGNTIAYFEYGTSSLYGSSTSETLIGEDAGQTALAVEVAGLAPGSRYQYRLVARNQAGISSTTDATFDTVADSSTVNLYSLGQTASETSGAAQFLLVRSEPTTGTLLVRIGFSGSATAGADYEVPPNSVEFPPGQLAVRVSLQIHDDPQMEVPESIVVAILPGEKYAVGSLSSATIMIADNDGPRLTMARTTSQGIVVRVQGLPGVRFRTESSTDLRNWGAEGEEVIAESGIAEYTDPQALLVPRRFFRVRLMP